MVPLLLCYYYCATVQYKGDAPESVFSAMLVSLERRMIYTAWRVIHPEPQAQEEMPKGPPEKCRNINHEGVVRGVHIAMRMSWGTIGDATAVTISSVTTTTVVAVRRRGTDAQHVMPSTLPSDE